MTSTYASSRVLSMLDCMLDAVVMPADAQFAVAELRAGDVNAHSPRGTRGRSAAMVAESVDVAEHSPTLDCALDGGLSAAAVRGLRAAPHDQHTRRLNRTRSIATTRADSLGIAAGMRASSSDRSLR